MAVPHITQIPNALYAICSCKPQIAIPSIFYPRLPLSIDYRHLSAIIYLTAATNILLSSDK